MTPTALPNDLISALIKMRRDPCLFAVLRMTQCKFGCGKNSVFAITHPRSNEAGAWCEIHGWIFFDSVKIRPRGEEYIPKRKRLKKAA